MTRPDPYKYIRNTAGHYQVRFLQFDSPNAPVIFQAVMNNVFTLGKSNVCSSNPRHQLSEFALVYIDIFGV